MPSPCSFDIRKMRNRLRKQLTVALFFILPVKVTNVFVSLSLVSLILKLRELDVSGNQQLANKIGELLKIKLSDDIFLLPQQTFSWYWTADVLSTPLEFDGHKCTLAQAICDKESFLKHRSTILNILLDSLPSAIKIKLGLYSIPRRLEVKHCVVSALRYA